MHYIYIGLFLMAITAIITVARWALIIIIGIAAIWLTVLLLCVIYSVLRWVYHGLNPSARKRFQAHQANKKAAAELLELEAAAYKEEKERKKEEKERTTRLVLEEKILASKQESARKELSRQHHRDADIQESPYTYEIGQHANEALAIRYGIANQERNKSYPIPSRNIKLKKMQPLHSDQFLAVLTDHGDRKVRVVIERGTEYVKTFLPLDDAWFNTHRKLEETLKNNKSFSLKELASFHVQKVV